MTDNEIVDKLRFWVKTFPKSYFKKIKARKNLEVLKYVEENTPLLSDPYYLISTKVFWIINGIVDFPKCVVCGRPIKKNIKVTEGYPKHCSPKCLAADEIVKLHKEEAFSRKYGNGIINPFQSEVVKKQIAATMLEKYGKTSYTQTEEYRERVNSIRCETELKRIETMTKNNSFHESKLESIVEGILRKKFPDLKTQYRSDVYPFKCDFFIPSTSQYIEYNGTWTHGKHPFDPTNPKDIEVLNNWKNKNSKYYENAIETWTCRDVKKREIAKHVGLNLVELWNISDAYKFAGINLVNDLEIPFSRNGLLNEFSIYKNCNPIDFPTSVSKRNYIIKFFQQDIFFKSEKYMWKNNPDKRDFIIQNRETYLHKHFSDLSISEILAGFKISGLCHGYSHFNPMWFRWFISQVGCYSVYDPFGGWGHRLLGGLTLEKYIYNDLSLEIKKNVDRIIEYFHINNTETHSEDAMGFIPNSHFDSIFTCPPYFNVEEYPCGKFINRDRYDKTLRFVYDLYLNTENCRTMGIVIREDFILPEMNFYRKIQLNTSASHLISDRKRNLEYLYMFKKD